MKSDEIQIVLRAFILLSPSVSLSDSGEVENEASVWVVKDIKFVKSLSGWVARIVWFGVKVAVREVRGWRCVLSEVEGETKEGCDSNEWLMVV